MQAPCPCSPPTHADARGCRVWSRLWIQAPAGPGKPCPGGMTCIAECGAHAHLSCTSGYAAAALCSSARSCEGSNPAGGAYCRHTTNASAKRRGTNNRWRSDSQIKLLQRGLHFPLLCHNCKVQPSGNGASCQQLQSAAQRTYRRVAAALGLGHRHIGKENLAARGAVRQKQLSFSQRHPVPGPFCAALASPDPCGQAAHSRHCPEPSSP